MSEEERKVCPIFKAAAIVIVHLSGAPEIIDVECIKEDCEFWNVTNKCCGPRWIVG